MLFIRWFNTPATITHIGLWAKMSRPGVTNFRKIKCKKSSWGQDHEIVLDFKSKLLKCFWFTLHLLIAPVFYESCLLLVGKVEKWQHM